MNKLLVLIVMMLFIKTSNAQTEMHYKILKLADLHRAGQMENVSWDLSVKNYKQAQLENELTVFVEAKTTADNQFVLVSFRSPKKFEGQKLLVRNNSMWFSKKGVDRAIAISGRQRLTGSAANADIANANYFLDYNIKSVTEERLANTDCLVFHLIAKNNYVSYYHIKYWISKDNNLGLKAEFYGKSDKLIKTAEFEYENPGNHNGKNIKLVSKTTIKDGVNHQDYTILHSSNFNFNTISTSKFEK
jgi:negative regulator of sigma E activity